MRHLAGGEGSRGCSLRVHQQQKKVTKEKRTSKGDMSKREWEHYSLAKLATYSVCLILVLKALVPG